MKLNPSLKNAFLMPFQTLVKITAGYYRILFPVISLVFITYYSTEYYFKYHILDLPVLKKDTRLFIRDEMKRAVDFGVLDFSLLNGVTIEDIKISGSDDFSESELFLKAEKTRIEFSKLLAGKPYIRKILIVNAELNFNLEDNLFGTLEDYLVRIDAPEIEIINLRLKIRKGELKYFSPEVFLNINIRKKKDHIYFDINENKPFFWATDRINGKGDYQLKGNHYNIEAKFNKLDAGSLVGVLNEYYYVREVSGTVEGEFQALRDGGKISINGKIFSEQLKVHFNPVSVKLNLKNFTHEYRFTNDSGLTYEGDFESNRLVVKINNSNNNIFKLSLLSRDLSSVAGSMEEKDKDETVKAEFTVYKTEKNPSWFQLEGGILVKKFRYASKEIKLLVDHLNLSINRSGNLISEGRGQLFDKKFSMILAGNVSIAREKKNYTEFYFPVKSDLNIRGSFPEIEIFDFHPLYNSVAGNIAQSISERERKLLPEEFFFYKPFYKYFLQNQKSDITLEIGNLTNRGVGQGSYKISGLNQNSVLQLRVAGENILRKDNFAVLNVSYGIAKPVMSLVSGFSLPWQGQTIDWCGNTMTSGFVEIDYNFSSTGNDFMEISSKKSVRKKVLLKNSFVENSLLPENQFKTFSYDETGYGNSGNYNSVEITGSNLILKGYGSYNESGSGFSLYGTLNEKPATFNLENNGKKCIVK